MKGSPILELVMISVPVGTEMGRHPTFELGRVSFITTLLDATASKDLLAFCMKSQKSSLPPAAIITDCISNDIASSMFLLIISVVQSIFTSGDCSCPPPDLVLVGIRDA